MRPWRKPKVSCSTLTAGARQLVVQDAADEIRKYKELLDSGILTQEEFDRKKAQLLDL